MRATKIHGAGDVRIADVADPKLVDPTDAVVRITRTCICGSDLWPYKSMEASDDGDRIGHEFIGVIDEVGAEVSQLKVGDVVVAPFLISDGTCDFCGEGWTSSCRDGGFWGQRSDDGCQGEAARVPHADGTLVKLPVGEDDALMPSLLTLSDVFCTGHHAAVMAGVKQGTHVTVIGDGAVGLSAVLAAKRLGAERIILMSHHEDRAELGSEFGATDIVSERGDEGIARVHDLTGGDGTHAVLECVGLQDALETGLQVARKGGVVSRVGAPQYEQGRLDSDVFFRNIGVVGGVAPARAYIPDLLPDVLEGKIEPGKVFDRTVALADVPDGYRAMNDREALKVLIKP